VIEYYTDMKRKAFGLIAIFLVMFQMFSPWLVNTNTASAQTAPSWWTSATKINTGHAPLIGAQKGPGNSFFVFTGGISDKSIAFDKMGGGLFDHLGPEDTVCRETTVIGKDDAKVTFYDKPYTAVKNYEYNPQREVPIIFTDSSTGQTYTWYETYCSSLIDTKILEPKADGSYAIELRDNDSSLIATLAYDPNKENTIKYNYPITPKNDITPYIELGDFGVEYYFDSFQIDKIEPVQQIDNGEIGINVTGRIMLYAADNGLFQMSSKPEEIKPIKITNGTTVETEDSSWAQFDRDPATAAATDEPGFYIQYAIDNKDADASFVDLNPLLFSTSSSLSRNSSITFTTFLKINTDDLGKTIYLKMSATEYDPGSPNDIEEGGVISFNLPTDIASFAQTSDRGSTIQTGDAADNANPAWLPKCGTDWLLIGNGGSLTGCAIQIFYWLIFVPSSYLLAAAGSVLDFVLAYSIKPDAYKAQYIVDGWRFIRDVCNLFFILMLIYLAFKTIMGAGHGTKQAIVNTLIVATVINFSYPLTTVIIDASNITARQLYYNAFNKQDEEGKPLSLSGAAAKGYNPQKIIIDGLEKNPTTFAIEENKGTVFMILLIGVIFNIIAILMFIKLALQFIYRIIGLIFAIILSPLAVFSYSLSAEQRSKLKLVGFDTWMSGLLTDAFKAPVFLFLVMILILFVNNNPFSAVFGPDVNGLEWWVSLIVPFMLIVAFFKVITSITKDMTSKLAQMAGEGIVNGISSVAGMGLGLATGGVALAGRSTIGKWAANKAEGMRNSDGSLIKDTWWNRQKLKAFDGTAKGSFDVRQTAAGNYFSKETGINMDNKLLAKIPGVGAGATAGGYLAMQDRKRARAIERAKFWEHNKKLEDDLNHDKEHLEKEIKNKESSRDDVSASLKEVNKNLKRYSDAIEKAEKDIDKNFDQQIKDNAQEISRTDQIIATLTSQLATAKTQAEKDAINNSITSQKSSRSNLVTLRNNLETARKDAKDNLSTTLEVDDGHGKTKTITIGQSDKTALKSDAKKLEDKEIELNKQIADIKKGKEVEIDVDDGHGHIVKKKVRVGGIAGIEKDIDRVKKDRMLRATLEYKRKKTGDSTELVTYEDHYKKSYGADWETKAKEVHGNSWESIKTTAHSGYTVGKDGHKHEVTHLVDDHFHAKNYKNSYKFAGGGASGGGHDDHGHDDHGHGGGHDDHSGGHH
jgi:hypothetical protein